MGIVVSKTAETNAVQNYYVTALAGPRIGKVRVAKGDEVKMSEYQARGLVASGEIVADKALIDDPWQEAAATKAAQEAADREVAEAKAVADKAAADAKAAADKVAGDGKGGSARAVGPAPVTASAS